jgi:hypothetical protein
MQMKLLGTTNVDFGVIDQRLIRISVSGRYWRKNESIMVQLFIDLKKAYDSVRREVVLYSMLIEFGILRKLVGLIQMCLNETYSTACGSRGSSISIVSDCGLDGRGSIPDRGRGFFP